MIGFFLGSIAHIGCAQTSLYRAGGPDGPSKDGVPPLLPERIPDRVQLFNEVPVLVVTVDATPKGYTVSTARRSGVPTSSLVQDRAVAVTAKDPAGATVATVSVPNPREVHAVGKAKSGARDEGRAEVRVVERGRFTVMLPSPERIASVEVHVRSGPDAGVKQAISVR